MKPSFWQRLAQQSDLVVAVGIIGLLAMMLVPLPPFLLDLLLTLNLALALCIILVAMYITEPLEFSVFPSLLLVATLFRLALNVSSTRLILLHAAAGHVIEAFGNFVVGGDLVVGFVVFIILVVIQFIVITNGAGRVAEVAARFTLDEMPGKQMAIDADLNAGLTDEAGAKKRRQDVEREADFYGAMDGASKFVRGDAIVGIIIVLINVLGGLIIGVLRLKMPAAEALQRYALLTVGDGLVTQIPALLISTATGLVVTRAASERNMGADILGQLVAQPRAVVIAAALLLCMGLVPGLPKVSFFLIGGLAAVGGYLLLQREQKVEEEVEAPTVGGGLEQALAVERISMQVGYGLIGLASPPERHLTPGPSPHSGEGRTARAPHPPAPLSLHERGETAGTPTPLPPYLEGRGGTATATAQQGGGAADGTGLLGRINGVRKQIATDLGLVVPPIRIRDDINLGANEYVIRVRGAAVARGEVRPSRLLALSPGAEAAEIPGEDTRDPAFGMPAKWIAPSERGLAEARRYTVVEPSAVMATHLSETIKQHAADIISLQDTHDLIEHVRQQEPAVVTELVPESATVSDVLRVLRGLLAEGVPIRDLATILEAMADAGRFTRKPDEVVEIVRLALSPVICERYRQADGTLNAVVLDPDTEREIQAAVIDGDRGATCALEPKLLQQLVERGRAEVDRLLASGAEPLLLTAPQTRRHVRGLLARQLPMLAVISHAEIPGGVEVKVAGRV